jgi:hypothetical protein
MTTSQDTTKVETQGLQPTQTLEGMIAEEEAQAPAIDERMHVLGIIDEALAPQRNAINAAAEDPRLKDPKVLSGVIAFLDAIQAANQREIAKIDEKIALTVLRLADLHALIDAAFAEPGSVDVTALAADATELTGKLSTADMSYLWKRLGELRESQPEPPDPNDAANWADHLCYVSISTKPWEHMEPAAKALYHAGCELLENDPESFEITMGHLLMLDALIASPGAAQRVVECVRRMLVESDSRLAMFKR